MTSVAHLTSSLFIYLHCTCIQAQAFVHELIDLLMIQFFQYFSLLGKLQFWQFTGHDRSEAKYLLIIGN